MLKKCQIQLKTSVTHLINIFLVIARSSIINNIKVKLFQLKFYKIKKNYEIHIRQTAKSFKAFCLEVTSICCKLNITMQLDVIGSDLTRQADKYLHLPKKFSSFQYFFSSRTCMHIHSIIDTSTCILCIICLNNYVYV